MKVVDKSLAELRRDLFWLEKQWLPLLEFGKDVGLEKYGVGDPKINNGQGHDIIEVIEETKITIENIKENIAILEGGTETKVYEIYVHTSTPGTSPGTITTAYNQTQGE